MDNTCIYIQNLRERARIPENGILSQTLQDGEGTKVVLFGFAPGQELSAHTAPFPAIITILKGEAVLKLGSDEHQGVEGTFAYMPPYLEHGIQAKTEVVMLLTMIKSRGAASGS
ncbi:MAG: cupin domain-containing protein [Acidobacteriia bacterium]|nr:cupin domain-containing protein [Terriglobia bacterium]